MDLKNYFATDTGFSILATAGADGSVDAAVYSRPHIDDNETVAFIMAERKRC